MRQGSNGRRPRGRPNRKQHGGVPRSNNFDSNGPEGRIRGNAHQVYEKYLALARDAVSAGDRIAAETYYQHAEHYFRILNASTDPQPNGQNQAARQQWNGRFEEPFGDAQPGGPPPVAGLREGTEPAAQPDPAPAQPVRLEARSEPQAPRRRPRAPEQAEAEVPEPLRED